MGNLKPTREIIVQEYDDIPDIPFYSGEVIVRCKDCKHFQEPGCPALMSPFKKLMCGEDYCSRGERKE